MQQPDYYYNYSQNPNPNPNSTDHYPPPPLPTTTNYPPPPPQSQPQPYSSTASAPPYTTNYPVDYSSSYPPPYTHSPDQPLYQPQPPPSQSYYSNYAPQSINPNPNLNNSSSNYQFNPYDTSNYQTGGGYEQDYSLKYDAYGGLGGPGGGLGGSGGATRYDSGGGGDGVYAYTGSKVEPYGSRGTGSKSSMWKDNNSSSNNNGNQQVMFDDFGRPIGLPSGLGKGESVSLSSPKIVKAVPKMDSSNDVKGGGVQKFRVKLLAESGGQYTQDVLCQIGLDGIRMLDPSTSRTLRIYPLDTITRCEVMDSSIFTFWSKSSVDFDARRIRLQSNSYTTNTLLDTVTAATIQLKEMGGRSRPADPVKVAEQPTEKKKGLGDWMNIIKPVNEEKDHWVPDEAANKCTSCGSDFGAFLRRHHCRNCGDIFCDKCTQGRTALTAEENAPQVRVCDRCMAEVTTRLSNAKDTASRTTVVQSHEDLAKKLQEELERNRKSSSGSKSDGSGRRMKEVACPTCTVHLQVQVPSSGSETIECGVCQHPFLVSSH